MTHQFEIDKQFLHSLFIQSILTLQRDYYYRQPYDMDSN